VNPIQRAVEILRAGGVVSFPTETVYGLGADATNSAAIKKIFQMKGRPPTNPLIVHIADASAARRYARTWPAAAEKLSAKLWPGPITLVVKKNPQIVDEVTAGLDTVALRAPDHPLAQSLLREFDGPIAAPSANRSTRVSPTTAKHVADQLGTLVDLILDGGPCRVGIESTVLDLTAQIPRILRPGGIDRKTIESIIGPVEMAPVEMTDAPADESKPALSPGQQPIHYSPKAPCFRFDTIADLRASITRQSHSRIVAILLDRSQLRVEFPPTARIIEMPARAQDYAHRLYAALHEADGSSPDSIWIEFPPDTPEWHAIRDRIRRAARQIS
jgi:L-threonylcarbamoyladenylate synthase